MLRKIAKSIPNPTNLLIERALIGSSFFIIAFWISAHSGFPQTSDELEYMAISLDPSPQAFILNRYFHIYLQRIFLILGTTPLAGNQLFWGFMISSTIIGIYALTRIISRSIFVGLLAVALFASQRLIFSFAGTNYADLTLMPLTIAICLAYYFFLDSSQRKKTWLFVLGLLLFLAFRTKETAGVFIFLVLGIGLFPQNKEQYLDWLGFRRNLIWVITGGFAGIFLMVLVDFWLIGDGLFFLRPSSWAELIWFNAGSDERFFSSYLDLFLAEQDLSLLLILSLVGLGRVLREPYDINRNLIWIMPILYLLQVSLVMSISRSEFETRYLFPIIPVLSVLGALTLWFWIGNLFHERPAIQSYLLILFVLLFALGSETSLINLGQRLGWPSSLFAQNVIFPLRLFLLLGALIGFRAGHRLRAELVLVIVASLVLPVNQIVFNDLAARQIYLATRPRFNALLIQSEYVECAQASRMLFSENALDTNVKYTGPNQHFFTYIINILYNCHLDDEDVKLISKSNFEDLQNASHILLTEEEWLSLSGRSQSELMNSHLLNLAGGYAFLYTR